MFPPAWGCGAWFITFHLGSRGGQSSGRVTPTKSLGVPLSLSLLIEWLPRPAPCWGCRLWLDWLLGVICGGGRGGGDKPRRGLRGRIEFGAAKRIFTGVHSLDHDVLLAALNSMYTLVGDLGKRISDELGELLIVGR